MIKSTPSRFERIYRIFEYIRNNSNKDNPLRLCDLKKAESLEGYVYLDNKNLNDTINLIANVLNSDENGSIKDKQDWKIVFDDFDSDFEYDGRRRIKNLYYQSPFSKEDVNAIIEALLFSNVLSQEKTDYIISKIKKELAGNIKGMGDSPILKVHSPDLTDRVELMENLRLINSAIREKKQIEFYFYCYNLKVKKEKVRPDKKDCVSPYYVVADNGNYYLIGSMEIGKNQKEHQMSIWRADLMNEIRILNKINVTDKQNVKNLPYNLTERFNFQHLNMGYDEPVPVTLKIDGNGRYTFLHDWFGNNFFYHKDKDGDYVEILGCSPFAMINWALQYSDRVEVVSPQEIRNEVKKRIEQLYKKYDMSKK